MYNDLMMVKNKLQRVRKKAVISNLSHNLPEETEEIHVKLVRIVGLLVEILTR
jgi:hypothetical protein